MKETEETKETEATGGTGAIGTWIAGVIISAFILSFCHLFLYKRYPDSGKPRSYYQYSARTVFFNPRPPDFPKKPGADAGNARG